MKLLVTGARGFLGRAVVAAARRRGHHVLALVRTRGPVPELPVGQAVELVPGDLCERGAWLDSIGQADAVIHLAMGVGGFSEQFAGTVVATENLLKAMAEAERDRLVHASTFSVYDYGSLRPGDLLDERTPIETRPLTRDAYLQTKLLQEQLVCEFASRQRGRVTVLRPGAIYGGGHLWNAGQALRVGRFALGIAPTGLMKLTYVENCAEAFVRAAEREQAVGATLNIVDDDLPTQVSYAQALRRHGFPVPPAVPVPYHVARAVARVASAANRIGFGERAKLPALLMPVRLAAQYLPLRYSNERAKTVLGWTPAIGLDEALDRCRARSG